MGERYVFAILSLVLAFLASGLAFPASRSRPTGEAYLLFWRNPLRRRTQAYEEHVLPRNARRGELDRPPEHHGNMLAQEALDQPLQLRVLCRASRERESLQWVETRHSAPPTIAAAEESGLRSACPNSASHE